MKTEEKNSDRKAYYKAYAEANKSRLAAYRAAYYIQNREKAIDRARAYRRAKQEWYAAYNSAYREKNRLEIRAKMRAYYKANKEKYAAWRLISKYRDADKHAAYRAANRDKRREQSKVYNKKIRQHREAVRFFQTLSALETITKLKTA